MDLQQLLMDFLWKIINMKKSSLKDKFTASLQVSWVPTERLTDLGSILALAL